MSSTLIETMPEMETLRWMRDPGDVLFSIGAVILGLFVIGLITGHSYEEPRAEEVANLEQQREVLVSGD